MARRRARRDAKPSHCRFAIDELRLLVRNANARAESFNQLFNADELMKLHRAQRESGFDFSPDEWTPRQICEALQGFVPSWDQNDCPEYGSGIRFEVKK